MNHTTTAVTAHAVTASDGAIPLATADDPGIVIAGVTIDAGPVESPVLLRVGKRQGNAGPKKSDPADPVTLSDVYFRVGGPHVGKADVALQVNSDHVLIDHTWVWRADHGVEGFSGDTERWTTNTGRNGVVVNGDHVTATPVDPRRYVQPPRVDSLDESPLNRISGWALDPEQPLLEFRPGQPVAAPPPAPEAGADTAQRLGECGRRLGDPGANPFVDPEGYQELLRIQTEFAKSQLEALTIVAGEFEAGRTYSEAGVNEILDGLHTFHDAAAIRRALCDWGYLGRERDGSAYWLITTQPPDIAGGP